MAIQIADIKPSKWYLVNTRRWGTIPAMALNVSTDRGAPQAKWVSLMPIPEGKTIVVGDPGYTIIEFTTILDETVIAEIDGGVIHGF